MSQHAYLIIAHNEWEILQCLLDAIDDERNDIFVHIDAKVKLRPNLSVKKSSLFILENRIDVRWGDFSVVEAEYTLFECAYKKNEYAYYHLLSGVDLPIKSQDYIHQYCNAHQGKEFIGFAHASEKELRWRTQHYFLYPKQFKSSNVFIRAIRKIAIGIQDVIGYKRTNLTIRKGSQWCSLTHSFVEYLLTNKELIYQTFHHTYCSDELFVQTLCWNSEFRENVYDKEDEFDGCKRMIKWENGELKEFVYEDLSMMAKSERWFARKFTSQNWEIVRKIENLVNEC